MIDCLLTYPTAST